MNRKDVERIAVIYNFPEIEALLSDMDKAREALEDIVEELKDEPSGNRLHSISEVYDAEFDNAKQALAATERWKK